ncbi:MAG: DUF2242 domain-containing protein [Variovorax sp.]|nr:MAG: DUF2242 domain-containing protein [Variovorax sp.]
MSRMGGMSHLSHRFILVLSVVSALALAGCGSTDPRRVAYEPEEFDSTTTHTRSFAATEAQTCEAARRALLSQGYLITGANGDLVTGRKSFQPDREIHLEVEFRVVCAREGGRPGRARSTVAFVSALQDRYGLKKANSSASVGVGAFGSLSVPFSSSDEAMVKIASETLTDGRFYDRFFSLLERFLATAPDSDPGAAEPVTTPVPPPALLQPPSPVLPVSPVRTDPVQAAPNRG